MTVQEVFDIANKLTVVAILLLMIWGIKEQWIVPGWVYTESKTRCDELERINNERATALEAKLTKIEEAERERWRGSQSNARP